MHVTNSLEQYGNQTLRRHHAAEVDVMPTSPMMFSNMPMPAVISPFPQMLSDLITVMNKLIDHGYPKAAADIVNLAAISPPCSPRRLYSYILR